MEKLRQLTVVGAMVFGVIACWPQRADGGIYVSWGVWCHAESAAPHYYGSRVSVLGVDGGDPEWMQGGVGRRLLERVLRQLAGEFARYLTAQYDGQHVLFPGCEVGVPDFEGRWEPLDDAEEARYARGGVLFAYGENEMTEVDWAPAFSDALRNEGGGIGGQLFMDCHDCPVMTVVPAGSFVMGSPADEAERTDSEGPQRTVTIAAPFAVGVHEVTFDQWDRCAWLGGCRGYYPYDNEWGRGRKPVIHVAWEDAQAYVEWLSSETGEEYRLLSEAEWEYVARAGTTASRYWGDGATAQCEFANGRDETASGDQAPCWDFASETSEVGDYEPNAFGLYDVLGNVWELTADCWHESYAGAPPDGRTWEGGDCDRHVLRGGGHYSFPTTLRSARRMTARTSYDFDRGSGPRSFSDRGFRVARVIDDPASGDGR